jgi:hypothetical protein
MAVPKPPFHSAIEELLYNIYLKLPDMTYLTESDINTLAKLNAILTDADLIKVEDVNTAINSIKGSVPEAGNTLEKLYNILLGWDNLTAEDIDTLAELNAILNDADLVKTDDLLAALNQVEANKWKFADLGNLSGATTVNLSGKAIIKFTQTAAIADFNFSNEELGRHYIIVMDKTVDSSFQFAAGRWSFPFGVTPIPTNPMSNGSSPAFARDIWTAVCLEAGRLTLIPSNNFLNN